MISSVGIGLIIVFIKLRKSISIGEYLGLRRIAVKTILSLLGIMAGLIVLSDGLSFALGRPFNPQSDVDMYNTSIWPPVQWMAVVVFAPAVEEISFRGFLFEGFRQFRMGGAATVFLTELTWTLLHIGSDIFSLVTIFVGGIALGVARLKTDSLWSPLLMHAFGNLVATLEIAFKANA